MKINYMRKLVMFIAVAFAGLLFTGCEKNPVEKDNNMEQSHTLILYFIGYNNMQSDLYTNIKRVQSAVDNTFPENGKIFAYFNRTDGNILYEVVRPAKSDSPAELIQRATYDQEISSTSAERMKQVVEDIKGLAKTETYGFVMGTHGAGWLPPGFSISHPTGMEYDAGEVEHEIDWEGSMTRHFGPDNMTYGSTEDLVSALSGQNIEYIIFDMCFMASVEFLYDLRSITPYIVASPVEIMIAGMPYQKMIPVLFSKSKGYSTKERLIKISDLFVKAYSSGEIYQQEEYRSAAITVINTSGLDALATSVKNIFTDGTGTPDVEAVQGLEGLNNHAFFDLRDYIYNISDNSALLAAFDNALNGITLFESHTAHIYSGLGSRGTFNSENICGISSYIPREQFPKTRQAYYNTAWGKFTQPGAGF